MRTNGGGSGVAISQPGGLQLAPELVRARGGRHAAPPLLAQRADHAAPARMHCFASGEHVNFKSACSAAHPMLHKIRMYAKCSRMLKVD